MGAIFSSKNATVFSSEKGLGYTRDGYTFYFDKFLDKNKWTQLTISGDKLETVLYLNGRTAKKRIQLMSLYKVMSQMVTKSNLER